jgi:acetate kinase
MRVLVLNPGSSTLKAALVADGATIGEPVTIDWPAGTEGADAVVADATRALAPGAEAVGYRVVHGGTAYRAPAAVDDHLLEVIEELDVLAPLHNRRAGAVINAGRAALPDLPHVACFDTAFHATLPVEAWRYPLPGEWVERFGIRRYGFHGLSVAWSVRRAATLLGRPQDQLRLVVAHLGSGCSVTAVDGGRSVDTSMGYTPYEGLMMGTRSGSIDPGILLRLADAGIGGAEMADRLAHASGLLAIAGTSDLREIETRAAAGDEEARLAIDMFARRGAACIGAAMTTLPMLDGLVFTGGIGEHSASMRGEITRRLLSLGIPLADAAISASSDGVLVAGPPAILVVEAREDLVIAEEVTRIVSA